MSNPLVQPLAQMIAITSSNVKASHALTLSPEGRAWLKTQNDAIAAAQAALSAEEKTTAATVGDAGYPTFPDICSRLGKDDDAGVTMDANAIIRDAIDWERERVAKVVGGVDGGKVVAWRFRFRDGCFGKWTDGQPDGDDEADANEHACTIQLAYDKPPAAQGFGPAFGSLNVRRFRGSDSMVNHDFEYLGSLPDGTYSLTVRQPVPADIIADAEWLVRWLPDESQQRTYALAIREWIRKVSA